MTVIRCLLSMVLLGCVSCSGHAQSPAETGPQPTLPAPEKRWIPTVNVAPAVGWPEGTGPTAAPGLAVTAFARGLDHPRWLYVLPNGDVLVAETNAPPKPAEKKGLRTWFMKRTMKKAGAATPSANRITLLRDADKDGVAEVREVFLADLMSPFGMALVDGRLYVANADAIVSVPYRDGQTRSTDAPVKLADLPGGPLNHHWTKSLLASADGRHLYVGVGSNSNVGENGMEMEADRAAVLQVEIASGARRVFAGGLRNPVGLAWEPTTGALWTVVNERDELGDALVPDLGARGCLLWLAVQLLRCARGHAGGAAASGPGGLRHRAGLRAGRARRGARPGVPRRRRLASRAAGGRLHRRARLLEPARAGRLQAGIRALRRWPAAGHAGGRTDRFHRPGRQGARTPGRRGGRCPQCGAAGGRRGQRDLARGAGRRTVTTVSPRAALCSVPVPTMTLGRGKMTTTTGTKRSVGYWIVAVFALVWNLIGVAMWYIQANMSAEQLALMTEPQRQVYEGTPSWINVAFAVAVFAGVLGGLGLLLKKRWAAAMFLLSLVALLVQMIGAFVATPAWAAYGPAGLVMPAVLVVIALFLLWYANKAKARSWLS
jgi:hypothetical protein